MNQKMLFAAGYSCRVILNLAPGVPVVLLHGLSYRSEVWQRLGVMKLLAEKSVPFLALDMPYGMRSECSPKTRSTGKNIAFLKAAANAIFGDQAAMLVGASLGGHIALKYASEFGAKGLLLVSPVRTLEEELIQSFTRFKFPVRIIWGSKDNIVSNEELRILSEKMPNAKLIIYEGSGHSAYVNQPDRFKRDLLELYDEAKADL